jgi:transcriptional/translational regulatory protein YebC/TACO1
MFNKKGSIVFDKKTMPEEELIELSLEAGAEDVKDQEDQFEVIISPEDFLNVKAAFDDKGLKYELAEITMVPQTTVRIEDSKTAQQLLRLMDTLEDHDDVQHVYANFDIPDEILESLE